MSGTHEPVDLTNCDREPIHQLGSVQPFGFLLAISSDWIVTRASANLVEFLDVAQADAIGRPVVSLITPEHSTPSATSLPRCAVPTSPSAFSALP